MILPRSRISSKRSTSADDFNFLSRAFCLSVIDHISRLMILAKSEYASGSHPAIASSSPFFPYPYPSPTRTSHNPFSKKLVPPPPLFCDVYANKPLTVIRWSMCVQIKDLAETDFLDHAFRYAGHLAA